MKWYKNPILIFIGKCLFGAILDKISETKFDQWRKVREMEKSEDAKV